MARVDTVDLTELCILLLVPPKVARLIAKRAFWAVYAEASREAIPDPLTDPQIRHQFEAWFGPPPAGTFLPRA